MNSPGVSPSNRKSKRLFSILFIGMALLFVVVIISVFIELETSDVRREVDEALGLERDFNLLLTTIQAAETGQRGYLLTGEKEYRTPYRYALDTIHPIISRIDKHVIDYSDQHERVERVRDLTLRKFAELTQTISLMEKKDTLAAMNLMQTRLGYALMREITEEINELRAVEQAAISERDHILDRLSLIITILRLLALAGIIFVFYQITVQIRPLVSELNEAGARNQQLIRSLNERNAELDQFAYLVSHDLREPLRTISNFSGLLREEKAPQLGEDGMAHVSRIERLSLRMQGLIESLLRYSRIGKSEAAPNVDLNQIIEDAMENLASSIKESGAGISVGRLPTVQGYPIELRQLFQNLIVNAIKFSVAGRSPIITISATPLDSGHRVSVRDNGVGIAETDRQKIFKVFSRLENTKEKEGHGIGLAFCRKIVNLHGGSISVESEVGTGSTFHIDLPDQQTNL